MEKKKVLILGKLPPPFMGPAIATQIILNSKLSHSFRLLHFNTTLNKSISSIGKFSISKLWANIRGYFRLFAKLAKHRPHLTLVPISQSTMGFVKDAVFILISRLFSKRVLLQLRGSNFKNWLAEVHPITRKFIVFILTRADGVIVLGNNLKYLFSEYFPDDRIYVVPNGADYDIPSVRKSGIRLLYLANLKRSKGFEDVLKAIAILRRECYRELIFDAVGHWQDDAFRRTCENIIQEEKLDVNIHAPISGEKKFRFYAAADLFLFAPREPEGHPWVIVEAMASGLPIISTDQGAIRESVENGVNGFIVEPQHPEQIAEHIKLLLNDEAALQRMGEQSRRIYEERFTEERMVENLTHVFNELIA